MIYEINKHRKTLETMVIELDRTTRTRDSIRIEKSADQLDQLLGAQDREFESRRLEFESARLRAARVALARIKDGSYGICEECEEPISPRRLAAMPSAVLCIRCQQEEDCRCAAKAGRPMVALAA